MTSFVAAFLCSAILSLGSYFYFAAHIQPYSGSQTRTGGYLERDFGWNEPYPIFPRPHFAIAESLDQVPKSPDILVVGDSFSHDLEKSWLNYFNRDDQLTITFLHIESVDFRGFLSSNLMTKHPPKILVFQSMEGSSLVRFTKIGSLLHNHPALPSNHSGSMPKLAKITSNSLEESKRSMSAPFKQQLEIAGNYIGAVSLRLLGVNLSPTHIMTYQCETCFSHLNQGEVLINKANLQGKIPLIPTAIVGMNQLKQKIEANGLTKVWHVIFPNKSSVYAPYITNQRPITLLDQEAFTADASRAGHIDLLPPFRREVRQGIRDLYLPNDHHCGPKGYALAAKTIARAIIGGDQELRFGQKPSKDARRE